MLIIRPSQSMALSDNMRELFIQRLQQHLIKHFPIIVQYLDKESFHSIIANSISQCEALMVHNEVGVCLYSNLMMVFGSDFVQKPEFEPIRETVLDISLSEEVRIVILQEFAKSLLLEIE